MSTAGLTCAIHQPNFFPRLSTLAKLYTADCWIVLDDVQFTRRDYQHRCRLAPLHDSEHSQWLTLPVHLPDGRTTRIKDAVLVDPELSRRRVHRLIQHHYRRSPYWKAIAGVLSDVDAAIDTAQLVEAGEASTLAVLNLLGWKGKYLRSSAFAASHDRSERLADLAHTIGATTYLCGTGGARYLNPTPFQNRDIGISYVQPPADTGPWSSATKTSALWPLALYGPEVLQGNLDQYAADHLSVSVSNARCASGDR